MERNTIIFKRLALFTIFTGLLVIGTASFGGQSPVTYLSKDPTLLVRDKDSMVSIETIPDKVLYRPAALPRITIRTWIPPRDDIKTGATLSWRWKNGFGAVVQQQNSSINKEGTQLRLPSNSGYYELIVQLIINDHVVDESRRSFGILPAPNLVEEDQLYGLWVRGYPYYSELGVRWTRMSVKPKIWKKNKTEYIRKMQSKLDEFRKQGISSLLYLKNIPKEYGLSKKVIVDTPEAWLALEEFMTQMVLKFKGRVGAWGMINEPQINLWAGDNELIMRYWQMMRKIIDQHDPNTPLIGPCINPNRKTRIRVLEQFQNLVARGFLKLVDQIEFHTYLKNLQHNWKVYSKPMPVEVDWEGRMKTVYNLVKRAGQPKPFFISEMGLTAGYEEELYQAQFLVRSYLWAKKINFKTLIWHDFGWPQAPNTKKRNYALFRSGIFPVIPQPRPAAIAYGIMTRQLAGAKFIDERTGWSNGVKCFVFQRKGKSLYVFWSTDTLKHTIKIPFEGKTMRVTDLFGTTKTIFQHVGIYSLTVDASPKYIESIN